MAGSNHKVEIVVGVRDLASRSLRGIQNTVNGMGRGFNNAGNFMSLLNRGLDSTIGKMDKLANSMYKFNMYTSSLQRNLRNVALIGGGIAGAVAVQGTNKAIEFDYNMRKTQARMGASDKTRKEVSDYILSDLANKVSYTPNDIALMGTTLGQAGINNAPDMKAMMKTTSYFSEAVDAVPDQAAEMIISAAKGFGISMKDSQSITDKLTIALNQSLLHVEEMPHAIGELAGRANMFGQGLDASLTALMTMRDQGVDAAQGSQDFLHALRQGSRIGNDDVLFKKTKGYFTSLGISNAIFDKDTRKLKEFPELIADIENAMVKQGFTNPKYNIKSKTDYENFLAKNGGKAPQDFWDSMKAMPLITRIFGAAGQAPILMGLQSKYEEVDKKTGEKTGKVYYGSEALKQMYNNVKNSDGAVNETHAIMAKSAKYQIEVLKGAWEGAQIKFLDGIVPVIKTGAEQLTKFFGGGKGITGKEKGMIGPDSPEFDSPLKKFRTAVEDSAKNFEKDGHSGTATVVRALGNGLANGAEISKTIPSMTNQIGTAFNKDMVKADWGSNIITFPWSIVKNGIKFISDILKANKEFDDAVSKLPKNLQDPAKLMETLTKGGIVLMLSGVIVKVIELAIRSASATMKVAKGVSEAVLKLFGIGGGKGKGIADAFGKNMAIRANIVNVYGGAINNRGGAGGVPGGVGGAAATAEREAAQASKTSKAIAALKKYGPLGLAVGANAALAIGSAYVLTHPKETSNAMQHNPIQKQVEKLGPQTDKKIKEMHQIMKDPSKYTGPRNTELRPTSEGFFHPHAVKSKANAAQDPTSILGKHENGMTKIAKSIDKFLSTSKKEKPMDTQKYLKSLDDFNQNNKNITTSIVGGFNAANEKIQNIKVNNNVSVNVAAPSVNISGNIKQYMEVQKEKASFTVNAGSQTRDEYRDLKLMSRRQGLR